MIVKADRVAADRLLTAAVRKARAQIGDPGVEIMTASPNNLTWTWRRYDREAIVDMLTAATIAADVLLEDRP